MKIVAISDLHGYLPELPESDVIVLAGDFSPLTIQTDHIATLLWCKSDFIPWTLNLRCKRFIFIAGNHDFTCVPHSWKSSFYSLVKSSGPEAVEKVVYLENTSYTFESKVFFGCPYSDIPNWAFSTKAAESEGYSKIKSNLDVLLVHQAPDYEKLGTSNIGTSLERNFGSCDLFKVIQSTKPKVVVCGHIHSGNHNEVQDEFGTRYFNASVKNEQYKVEYLPQVFEI